MKSRIYTRPYRSPSPWLAVNLSVVVPGLGQCYGGAWGKGGAIALACLGLSWFAAWSLFAPQGNTLTGLLMVVILAMLYLTGLVDAYRTLAAPSAPPISAKASSSDPWYAVLLSQVLPGLGHLHQQKALAGGLFMLIGTLTAYFANFHPLLLPLPPLIWAVACAHLYQGMTARRDRQGGFLAIVLVGMVVGRLAVGAIPLMVRSHLEQCIVPSTSMAPTLEINDRLFVRKQPDYQPQLQDVVVFQVPPAAIEKLEIEPGALMVKRVIGLPGQQVEVRDGQVYVDGESLPEPYLEDPPAYAWGPETVPSGNLFVLGDNRNYSGDSHVWGFLPQAKVLGKAYKIYWPPARIQPLV